METQVHQNLTSTQSTPTSPKQIQQNSHVRTHRQRHSNTHLIQIDYDNYPYLLTEEVYDRKGKKSKFT